MHGNTIKRTLKPALEERLKHYPVVALLGGIFTGHSMVLKSTWCWEKGNSGLQ